jgi:predicted branched-subunit amino acid permease
MNEVKKSTIKFAFKTSLPVLAGILCWDWIWCTVAEQRVCLVVDFYYECYYVLRLTQYMGVELLATQASILTTAIISLVVNIRHLFYGITMLKRYKNAEKKFRPYIIFL